MFKSDRCVNYGNDNSLGYVESNAFEGSNIENATLHVPSKLMAEAQSTAPWNQFGHIVSMSENPEDSDVVIDGIYYILDKDTREATVTYQGEDPYSGKYTGEIIIPSSFEYGGVTYSVTSIGEYAFSYCYGLTSITIPSSVTSIGERAFCDCDFLTSICIPGSVINIGKGAFGYCDNLIYAEYGSIEHLCNIVFADSDSNPLNDLYNGKNGNNHLIINGNEIRELEIPSTVSRIKDYTFRGCSNLTSISIPEGVTSIGTFAFYACSGLTSISIPSSVTSIREYAFSYCYGLTSITIPSSVTSIESNAFQACTGLTSITIPSSVLRIKYRAFDGCSGLNTVTLNGSELDWQAFANCPELRDVYNYGYNYERWDGEKLLYMQFAYENAFEGSNIENATLHVPSELMAEAQSTEPWNQFGNIVAIDEINDYEDVVIGACGYATLYNANIDLEIPEGIKAYTGVVNKEWLTLTEVGGKIPAGTAVILEGAKGTYRFNFTSDAVAVAENDLKGSAGDVTANGAQYVLAQKNGTVGFYKADGTIPSGKAYLEIANAGVKGFFFNIGTGIKEMDNGQWRMDNAPVFDLSGRRVEKTTKGMYIINGKKVLK